MYKIQYKKKELLINYYDYKDMHLLMLVKFLNKKVKEFLKINKDFFIFFKDMLDVGVFMIDIFYYDEMLDEALSNELTYIELQNMSSNEKTEILFGKAFLDAVYYLHSKDVLILSSKENIF